MAAGDVDTDGIAVGANALSTPGASDIRTAAGDLPVALGHKRVRPDRTRMVDGALPAPVSAEAGGAVLTVTFGEALDEASVPAGAGGFAVAVGATGSRTVTGVAVSGKTAVLTLARGIAADTADVTVDYAPPSANPIRDLAGNAAAKFDDLPVTAVQVPNEPASGTVTVTGTATVGQTLTAAVSGVSDSAGLHAPPGYAYRWYRIDGTTERKISGAESRTYTLAAADAGKRIRVKVTFDDFLNNEERLQSAPYPEFERVLWPADSACAMPTAITNGTRKQIWTAEVGVGAQTVAGRVTGYGFGSGFHRFDPVLRAVPARDRQQGRCRSCIGRWTTEIQPDRRPVDGGRGGPCAACVRRHLPFRRRPRRRYECRRDLHQRHLHLHVVPLRPRLVGARDEEGVSEPGRHRGAGAEEGGREWRDADPDL